MTGWPGPATPGSGLPARQLVALYEGLQLQSQLRDGSDLLAGWDRAVARMRAGWGAVALV
ncbi:hypothetical protein [Curtobacterium aetherium]|uniref:Uncharacterized protein n=1 Tax=Curtobacterium aetherium TaxID=2841594 RepID=A0ACD1E2J1_9MICO|nr:hypothetical protein [Curtobacterium sp. L6-1]QWS33177.1 hypothetical protein KM842_13135 [Curtobacterium sp. L6-1]